MELTYTNPGFAHSIDSIMEFQQGDQSDWWSGALFSCYPQLDRAKFDALPVPQRADYLRETLQALYAQEESAFAEKIVQYNAHWQLHKHPIVDAFSDAFPCDCQNRFNRIVGHISLNPICPRYLETTSFDVFYKNSHRGALGMALHEIIHFVWFDVWHAHFDDDAMEYENPHLKWVLSEMVVDPIMRRDKRLSEINPYFAGGCAYDYFYTMKVEGKPILETLYGMYTATNMTAFMEQSYAYCLAHEADIRAGML